MLGDRLLGAVKDSFTVSQAASIITQQRNGSEQRPIFVSHLLIFFASCSACPDMGTDLWGRPDTSCKVPGLAVDKETEIQADDSFSQSASGNMWVWVCNYIIFGGCLKNTLSVHN